jgi:hypothetical protein
MKTSSVTPGKASLAVPARPVRGLFPGSGTFPLRWRPLGGALAPGNGTVGGGCAQRGPPVSSPSVGSSPDVGVVAVRRGLRRSVDVGGGASSPASSFDDPRTMNHGRHGGHAPPGGSGGAPLTRRLEQRMRGPPLASSRVNVRRVAHRCVAITRIDCVTAPVGPRASAAVSFSERVTNPSPRVLRRSHATPTSVARESRELRS